MAFAGFWPHPQKELFNLVWGGAIPLLTHWVVFRLGKEATYADSILNSVDPLPFHSPMSRADPFPVFMSSKVAAIAAVGILLGSLLDTGPDRVQVNIAAEFQQIAVAIDNNRFVPPLKQMPATLALGTEVGSVRAIQVMHHLGQIRFRRFQQEVIMIPHQHVSMQDTAETLPGNRKILLEPSVIPLRNKYLLAFIPSCRDVIKQPGKFDPQWPGHPPLPFGWPIPSQLCPMSRAAPFSLTPFHLKQRVATLSPRIRYPVAGQPSGAGIAPAG